MLLDAVRAWVPIPDHNVVGHLVEDAVAVVYEAERLARIVGLTKQPLVCLLKTLVSLGEGIVDGPQDLAWVSSRAEHLRLQHNARGICVPGPRDVRLTIDVGSGQFVFRQ